MAEIHIAFIGAGNMAASIIGGLVAEGHPANAISASDPSAASLARLREVAPVTTFSDNREAVAGADVVVLAVKPQVMESVCAGIAPALAGGGSVALSIAAGIPVASLERWLGPGVAVIRCMPNTPALLGAGASGLYATRVNLIRLIQMGLVSRTTPLVFVSNPRSGIFTVARIWFSASGGIRNENV